MVTFATFTEQELEVVSQIVERAVECGVYADTMDAHMDIAATHVHCPLRLQNLLDADRFNFVHDMVGIKLHLDRQTGKLTNFFLPRFAA